MKYLIILVLLYLSHAPSIGQTVNDPQNQKINSYEPTSLVFTNKITGKVKQSESNRIWAATPQYGGKNLKGRLRIVNDSLMDVNGYYLKIEDMTEVRVPNTIAQISGIAFTVVGSALSLGILDDKGPCTRDYFLGTCTYEEKTKHGRLLGNTLLGSGIVLLFIKDRYDLTNDWTLQIQ